MGLHSSTANSRPPLACFASFGTIANGIAYCARDKLAPSAVIMLKAYRLLIIAIRARLLSMDRSIVYTACGVSLTTCRPPITTRLLSSTYDFRRPKRWLQDFVHIVKIRCPPIYPCHMLGGVQLRLVDVLAVPYHHRVPSDATQHYDIESRSTTPRRS